MEKLFSEGKRDFKFFIVKSEEAEMLTIPRC
jgi:hypothetical protein